MPFTLAAYHATAARAGYTLVAAAADTSLTPVGNGYAVPAGMNNIVAVYLGGASCDRGKIQAPSILRLAPLYPHPVDVSATPTNNPPWTKLFANPVPVTVGDELDAYIDAHGASEYDTALIWLSGGPLAPIQGAPIFPTEWTASTTVTAHKWSPCPITPTSPLEAGTYNIVGIYGHCTGGIAARLIFPAGQQAWRPGALIGTTPAINTPYDFRFGNAGVYGQMDSETPPQVEILSTGAPTAEYITLDLQKISTSFS